MTPREINVIAQQSSDDKQLLIQLIEKHKLEFLFYNLIKVLKLGDLFDESVIIQYSEKFQINQVKYNEYLSSMKPVFINLEEDIKYAVLKGFSFMDELYKTNTGIIRRFADIDLLIDKSDAAVVIEKMRQSNFIPGKVVRSESISFTGV